LIIAVTCANGVFIRSDKRRTIGHSDGSIEIHDDLNKVFVTTNRQIIIYNHGANVLNRVPWREARISRLPMTTPSSHHDCDAAWKAAITSPSARPHPAA
jgi:hypothetical protein